MVSRGDVFGNPRTGARIEIVQTPRDGEGDILVVERLMKPRTGKTDAHVHLDFEQSFEVLEGTATAELDKEPREVPAGTTFEVPVGRRHVDPYNARADDLRFRFSLWPVTPFIEGFVSVLGRRMRADDLNDQDEFEDLQVLVLLRDHRAGSYDARLPIPIQKALIPLGAAIGRRRGFRAT